MTSKYDRCIDSAMEYFTSRQDGRGSFAMEQEDLVAYYKPALAMMNMITADEMADLRRMANRSLSLISR